jgi:hypothetical protein
MRSDSIAWKSVRAEPGLNACRKPVKLVPRCHNAGVLSPAHIAHTYIVTTTSRRQRASQCGHASHALSHPHAQSHARNVEDSRPRVSGGVAHQVVMFVHPVWRGQERTDESSHTTSAGKRNGFMLPVNGGNRRVEEV